MSVDFTAKSYRIAARGMSETPLSGRRLASIVTGAAAALALVLATAIPARAEKNDGVDEVGRGPLAGPVTAAAVRLDPARHSRGAARIPRR
jgi:ribonuclease HIII